MIQVDTQGTNADPNNQRLTQAEELARLAGAGRGHIGRVVFRFGRPIAARPARAFVIARIVAIGHAGAHDIAAVGPSDIGRLVIDLQRVGQALDRPGSKIEGTFQ